MPDAKIRRRGPLRVVADTRSVFSTREIAPLALDCVSVPPREQTQTQTRTWGNLPGRCGKLPRATKKKKKESGGNVHHRVLLNPVWTAAVTLCERGCSQASRSRKLVGGSSSGWTIEERLIRVDRDGIERPCTRLCQRLPNSPFRILVRLSSRCAYQSPAPQLNFRADFPRLSLPHLQSGSRHSAPRSSTTKPFPKPTHLINDDECSRSPHRPRAHLDPMSCTTPARLESLPQVDCSAWHSARSLAFKSAAGSSTPLPSARIHRRDREAHSRLECRLTQSRNSR